jgi:hypothetical protein
VEIGMRKEFGRVKWFSCEITHSVFLLELLVSAISPKNTQVYFRFQVLNGMKEIKGREDYS